MHKLALALAAGLIAHSATAETLRPTAPPPSPVVVAPMPFAQALVLVRASLVALHQANLTNDYNVLYRLGTRRFQATTTPDQLRVAVSKSAGLDLYGILGVQPTMAAPQLEAGGRQRIAGNFLWGRRQINFALTVAPEAGMWKLDGLAVGAAQ